MRRMELSSALEHSGKWGWRVLNSIILEMGELRSKQANGTQEVAFGDIRGQPTS